MEGFTILDTRKNAPIYENLKVGKVAKGSSRNVARKTLADISNLKQLPVNLARDEKPQCSSGVAKEYVEQLQKENMALMQMLADRNKIIQVTGNELLNLRVNLQKMQHQNQQLAQSNSQLLAELNSGKDKLKALQHELGCKNGLLKVKNMEDKLKALQHELGCKNGLLKVKNMEEEEKLQLKACQKVNNEVKCMKAEDPGEPTAGGGDKNELSNTRRRLRSKSLAPAMHVESNARSKRACTRRQSGRFKAEELESSEGGCETTDSVPEICSTSTNGTMKDEDSEGNDPSRSKSQEHGRSSLARPSRRAAAKVQSYKEVPLNVKMRREE